MVEEKGWKPIPLLLKILFVVLVLWTIGSLFAVPMRSESGLPFFGLWIYGIVATLIVFVLDILAPITFLVGLWNRKSWTTTVAFSYMTVFVLNSIIALFTVREQLGTMQIVMPALFTIIFLIVIYNKRDYLT